MSAPPTMPLQPADRLGPYEIRGFLGAGGMGEVYRGRDTRLGRDVALKVLSPELVADASLRQRFEREAQAASALNHPNIVTVYDVGDSETGSWIAMELVEGRTLRQILGDGRLAVPDTVAIARQVADGLATAHARGIVHRDLKPENVMVSADGRGKILDFGLARDTMRELADGPTSPGLAVPGRGDPTRHGMILGTVGYMSPEQASGRPVDFRSDQFSFGLIVYEMLTGRRAFTGPTAVETLAAVIRDEPPPLDSIRDDVPDPLRRLVATCLAKRPEGRFRSTRDLVATFDGLGSTTGASWPAAASASWPAPDRPARSATAAMPRARVRFERKALGLAVAIAVASVLTVLAWTRFQGARNAIGSLAVFPFENASKDPDAEYLGDGLAESLIDRMSQVPSLKVMARSTVFRHKGADPLAAGRQLGVEAVLTGSVLRKGGQLSISAELVSAATGERMWGAKYERPLRDLLEVQDSLASDIAEGLRLRLSGEEEQALARRGTTDAEAYDLVLRARALLARGTEEDDLEARRLFEDAITKDPASVDARMSLAATYARSAGTGYAPPAPAWERVEAEARKVLELEPGNVRARAALAARRVMFEWDWAGAEREFRDLGGDPRLLGSPQFHPVAMFHWARGRADEAAALAERALRVDSGNVETRIMLADFLAQAGHLDQALEHYRALVQSEPADARPLHGLAEVLRRRGDVAGAIEALRKAFTIAGEEEGARALDGARTERDYDQALVAVARLRLAALEEFARERYVSPLDLAGLHAQAGDRDRAFARLDEAMTEKSAGLVFLKVDRAWDRIRDDPRFAAIVRRVGIP